MTLLWYKMKHKSKGIKMERRKKTNRKQKKSKGRELDTVKNLRTTGISRKCSDKKDHGWTTFLRKIGHLTWDWKIKILFRSRSYFKRTYMLHFMYKVWHLSRMMKFPTWASLNHLNRTSPILIRHHRLCHKHVDLASAFPLSVFFWMHLVSLRTVPNIHHHLQWRL